jgi:uncharacterized protein YciI
MSDDSADLAQKFAALIAQHRDRRGAKPHRLTQQHIDYLRRSYSEGALTFGSEEHDTWVVDITEAAPFLLHMAEELLRRPP